MSSTLPERSQQAIGLYRNEWYWLFAKQIGQIRQIGPIERLVMQKRCMTVILFSMNFKVSISESPYQSLDSHSFPAHEQDNYNPLIRGCANVFN